MPNKRHQAKTLLKLGKALIEVQQWEEVSIIGKTIEGISSKITTYAVQIEVTEELVYMYIEGLQRKMQSE